MWVELAWSELGLGQVVHTAISCGLYGWTPFASLLQDLLNKSCAVSVEKSI